MLQKEKGGHLMLFIETARSEMDVLQMTAQWRKQGKKRLVLHEHQQPSSWQHIIVFAATSAAKTQRDLTEMDKTCFFYKCCWIQNICTDIKQKTISTQRPRLKKICTFHMLRHGNPICQKDFTLTFWGQFTARKTPKAKKLTVEREKKHGCGNEEH